MPDSPAYVIYESIDFPFETFLLSLFKPWVVIEKHILSSEYTTGRKELDKKQFEDCTFRNSRIQDNKAKRDLFTEFVDHQVRLHKKLAFLEGSISKYESLLEM
jgi:hypothetical protein